MQKELESYLVKALEKLEEATALISKEKIYDADIELMKILCELTKEQVKNENSSHPTR